MAATAAVATGCGGDQADPGPAGLPAAGGGGTLTLAVPRLAQSLDPLMARGSGEELIVRQLYEPLGGSLRGPYGRRRARPGLVLSASGSPDRRLWRLELRTGVRFGDETPLNASAVAVNARRWLTTPAGRSLLPELFAVDAPRPNEVRFLLASPVRQLPKRLAAPQLGIVSPLALEPRSGEGAQLVEPAAGAGSGPFEQAAPTAGELSLARNASWWGSDLGLGPALDGVSFVAAAKAERLTLLERGEVEVAGPLASAASAKIDSDPLLRVAGASPELALAASVRGLKSAVQSLSGVWLTTVGE